MKRVTFVIFLMFSSWFLFSATVSEQDAKHVAWYFYQTEMFEGKETEHEVKIGSTEYLTYKEDTLLYLFHFEQGGFVFISADDVAYPVAGYSRNPAPSWAEANVSVQRWMERQMEGIYTMREKGVAPEANISQAWASFLNEESKGGMKGVDPLFSSVWNQDYPYNEYAPADNNGPGGRAYAGCVAVCMAQLMYYYRYPESGYGNHGYYHSNYGYIQVDYGNTQYNFNAMVDDVGGHKNEEVARLLYHSAVGVEMNFGPSGSSASMYNVIPAMKNYFKYSDSAYIVKKSNYADSQWKSMIRHEIDQKRPLMYSGYPPDYTAGHAFNLDGYQGMDHFHFNWGWSGAYDGYYYLSSLVPGNSDFSQGQTGIFHMVPGGNYPEGCNNGTLIDAMEGTFDDGSGHYDYENNASCSWLIDPADTVSHIELEFKNVELEQGGDVIKVFDGADVNAPLLASFSGDSVPPVLTTTGDKLFVTFNTNATVKDEGFRAAYKAFSPVYCDGMEVIQAGAGLITDGSGTQNYNTNSFCRWYINPPGASWVTAEFNYLNTYDDDDIVAVYDPSTSPGKLLGKYYGNMQPPPVTSNSGKMLVVFSTSAKNTANGFELEYISDVVGTGSIEKDALAVYPNPSQGEVTIDIPPDLAYTYIEIRTMEGKLMDRYEQAERIQLDLPSGIYFVRLAGERDTIVKKLIITGNGS
ncbi:MAG: C10 family peptidase [Bacteroidales bacterium]